MPLLLMTENINTTTNFLFFMNNFINTTEISSCYIRYQPTIHTYLFRGGLEDLITLKSNTNIEITALLKNLRNANLSYLRLFYMCLNGQVVFEDNYQKAMIYRVFKNPDNALYTNLLKEGLVNLQINNHYNTYEKSLLKKNINIILSNINFIKNLNILSESSNFSTKNQESVWEFIDTLFL